MLAGIMSDQDQGAINNKPSTLLDTGGPVRPIRGPWQSKRRKIRHVDSGLVAAATNSSDLTHWWRGGKSPSAGELLCVQDPTDPSLIWPVLVASSNDIPAAVLEGRANESALSMGFPYDIQVRISVKSRSKC